MLSPYRTDLAVQLDVKVGARPASSPERAASSNAAGIGARRPGRRGHALVPGHRPGAHERRWDPLAVAIVRTRHSTRSWSGPRPRHPGTWSSGTCTPSCRSRTPSFGERSPVLPALGSPRKWRQPDHPAGRDRRSDGRFPQVAGFTFSFDYAKPTGCTGVDAARVCDPAACIRSRSRRDRFPPDSTVYTLATINFLNQGGDSYRMLLDGQTGENEILDAPSCSSTSSTSAPCRPDPDVDGRIAKCSGCAPS